MKYIDNEQLKNNGYVLQNKLNIIDPFLLAQEEEKITKKIMLNLYKNNIFVNQDILMLESLMQIHKILFTDIYEFAGKLRDYDISKNDFKFAHFRFLKSSANQVINEYKANKTIDTAIELYVSMNIIHPFCEGNGRATRFWFDQILLHDFNLVVNWGNIKPSQYMDAMRLSVTDSSLLSKIIKNNLISMDEIDEFTFFRGIDRSYEYEGMTFYKTKDLA